MTTVAEQVRKVPSAVRPTLQAAIRMVREIAPGAEEIVYAMEAPRSNRMVWKHVRFAAEGKNVVGIGTLPDHVNIWFYRGRDSSICAHPPTPSAPSSSRSPATHSN